MNRIKLIYLAILILANTGAFAQISINTDGSEADASAMLDVKSSDKGILIPRMTEHEIASIISPADGLLAYCTDDGKIYVYVLAENQWKEILYGPEIIETTGLYSIGSGGSCANTTLNGSYYAGIILDATNTICLDATVSNTGYWNISTDTVNGYSFSGSGTFSTTGTVQVLLVGTGTPILPQTDTFILYADIASGTCTTSITVAPACGSSITDSRNGQSYSTVLIGDQCWMAENLNIGTMVDGNTNQTDNGIIEKYCYDNTETNCDLYGGLYQWDEMMQYLSIEGTIGICPAGWHLPTNSEWITLEENLGMCSGTGTGCSGASGWRGTDEGSKLAGNEASWNNGALDQNASFGSSGFNGIAQGYRDTDGSFYLLGQYTGWWISNYDGSNAWGRELIYDKSEVGRSTGTKAYGFNVRCIRD